MPPKVSIITINYNDAKGLRAAAESIINQTYFNELEWIVIDGGSTDGSVDIIKEYAEKITYWVSEPDKGIYNAMNKGVAKARGEYLLFRNAGDLMYDDKVIENFVNHPAYGKYDHCTGRAAININGKWFKDTMPEKSLSMHSMYHPIFLHPITFMRRTRFERMQFDESLKIAADSKFFIHDLILHNASYTALDFFVCTFDGGGVSSQNQQASLDEHYAMIKEMLPPRIYADYAYLMHINDKPLQILTQLAITRTWECRILSYIAYVINLPRYVLRRARRLFEKLTHG